MKIQIINQTAGYNSLSGHIFALIFTLKFFKYLTNV